MRIRDLEPEDEDDKLEGEERRKRQKDSKRTKEYRQRERQTEKRIQRGRRGCKEGTVGSGADEVGHDFAVISKRSADCFPSQNTQ